MEYMDFGPQTPGTISINEPLTKALTFKYLGSYLSFEGGVTTAKIQTAWQKWKTLTGVLCNKKLPRKLKSSVYRTVMRPAVLYGSECWAITNKDEQRLNVMETTMLMSTLGFSRLEHTPNEMTDNGGIVCSEQSQGKTPREVWESIPTGRQSPCKTITSPLPNRGQTTSIKTKIKIDGQHIRRSKGTTNQGTTSQEEHWFDSTRPGNVSVKKNKLVFPRI
ncbi:hypothetical protein M513_04649 [Trichuris suis]|uniref:Reverse transcriptase domain-containing protein n=1 Tax=Trichuris suis TaxID=68888 RepID=A0A085MBA6_9BILA|nr:hypothetical protein M513_04649 [Trichuris suis]